ncbi:MAG: YHS domain-containing protein [Candidatus Competibacteraceae bacterium]
MNEPHAHCCTGPVDDRQPTTNPICGMRVTPRSPYQYELMGKTYYFCCEGCMNKFAASSAEHAPGDDQQTELKDPVCGMTVSADSKLTHTHAGKVYRFCGQRCLDKFKGEPERYTGAGSARQTRSQGYDLHLPDASGNSPGGAG